ncbi:DUF4328 domain-containing protein [Pasteurella sp. PK-2025]|uniref:DUF4328 domain-containing protein n=1 Tax=Pasteurella sp. PK-2025 TaxID=3413133 RepID=UPI003C74E065
MHYRAENHSKLVLALLGLDILIYAVQIWLSFKIFDETNLLLQQELAISQLPEGVAQLMQADEILHHVKLGSFILLGVIILSWIYRAHRFVHTSVNATEIKFTDAACVVYFFIPIANLFMPYKAMKETWLASESPEAWQKKPTPITLIVWWLVWLLRINLGFIFFLPRAEYFKDIQGINDFSALMIIDSALAISLALIFSLVVLQVERIQNKNSKNEPTFSKKEHKTTSTSLVS